MSAEGKLVRDRIPEIIAAAGRQPVVRRLGRAELRPALLAKLAEESAELAAAEGDDVVGELADVLEVVRALAAEAGVDWATVEEAASAKATERGAFRQGWLLVTGPAER